LPLLMGDDAPAPSLYRLDLFWGKRTALARVNLGFANSWVGELATHLHTRFPAPRCCAEGQPINDSPILIQPPTGELKLRECLALGMAAERGRTEGGEGEGWPMTKSQISSYPCVNRSYALPSSRPERVGLGLFKPADFAFC